MVEWQALFLGIVQGLTEFLPVSSSGHLIIFEEFMSLGSENAAFNVAVHLGTLLSVITVYFSDLKKVIFEGLKEFFNFSKKRNSAFMLLFYVGLSSIPTGLMGILLKDMWHALFARIEFVGVFFIITAFILYSTKNRSKDDFLKSQDNSGDKNEVSDKQQSFCENLNWKKALLLGVVQGLAIAPGISRSGSTIAAGLLLGLSRSLAAFYSFLLMIPAVFGAGILELKDVEFSDSENGLLLIGLITSYFIGVIALKLIIKLVKKGRLEVFSPYLAVLGILVLFYSYFT